MRDDLMNHFTIQRNKREPFFFMKNAHEHPICEVYYLLAGERRFFINDSIYQVHRGDLVLIEKGAIHRTSYGSDKMHERIFIYVPDVFLEAFYQRFGTQKIKDCFLRPLITISPNQRQLIEELFKKMEREYLAGDEYSPLLIKGYVEELFVLILRYQQYCQEGREMVLDGIDDRMQQVARYIRAHYMEVITLEDMAKLASQSASYFSKQFKLATGFGFKEYVLNVRLKEATKLLLETSLSITEVAYHCGFNDSNYFGDVFKRYKGISPMNYRKNNEWI